MTVGGNKHGRVGKFARSFFRWYCRPEYYEDIQGDLNELFEEEVVSSSQARAERWLLREVLMLFRPSLIKRIQSGSINHTIDMFRNYLTIAIRNLRKHASFTALNIFGLAIGLTAFLFLQHYNSFEKSYDRYHPLSDQLYRLTTDDVKDGRIQVRDAMSFAPSGKALMEELPEVIDYTTTYKTWRMVFRKDGQPVEENGVLAVDSNFLNLFGYEVIRGHQPTMLSQPNTLVLTESQSEKYFGSANPVGQTIHVLGQFDQPFTVTGVISDVPANTHYQFNTLVSLPTYQEQIDNDAWGGFNYYTYLRLSENADLNKLRGMLPALTKKYLSEDARLVFNLQPVPEIHLHSDFTFEPEIHGSAKAVRFLGIISIFILLIAWVNYINLSTARAIERAKEVSLRKVVGAQRRQLISQFLAESLLINLMGAVLALILAQLCIPYFNSLVGKEVMTDIWSQPAFLRNLALFFAIGTAVTGFYPAIVLSSFRPMQVLRGAFGRSKQGALMRKMLVTLQFVASLILISSTIIIYKQIGYMTSRDLGINTEQVIGFETPPSPELERDQQISKYKTFLDELTRTSGVSMAASISNLPGGGSSDVSSNSSGVTIVGLTERKESTIYMTRINDQLLPTLDIELIAGRNFDHETAADTAAAIVNLSLLNLVGIADPETVINQKLQLGRNPENPRYTIVGVIADYNRSSLKHNVEPTIFWHSEITSQSVARLQTSRLTTAIEEVRSIWSRFYPAAPFNYTFLDQRFEQLYAEDKRFGLIFLNFAILAILVASMGLFGLASYLSLQRMKEVGIRKVLGASVTNIVAQFFKGFLVLIILASLIGVPIIYLSMDNWLNGFAYRLDFPWWVIGLAIVMVGLFAFITVSYQTWKLARLNPANTMRTE